MNLTTEERDRVDLMAQRLEHILNSSAEEYMESLHNYMETLQIPETWPRLPKDMVMDKTVGVVWVALIPVLYFMTVAAILGLLVAYIWYSEHWRQLNSDQASTDISLSTEGNRFRGIVMDKDGIREVNNNNNEIASATFVRSSGNCKSGNVVDSIVRASLGSRGSIRSVAVITHDTKYFSDTGEGTTKTNHLSLERSYELHSTYSIDRRKHDTTHPINICIGNNSFGSNDSSEDGDRLSKDSLRTSMESQKLLATGVVEIAPDDLYSLSDNTAYTEYNDCRKVKEDNVCYEICTNSGGLENPNFQKENDTFVSSFSENYHLDRELALFHNEQQFYPQNVDNMNISSISSSTTNYRMTSAFRQQKNEIRTYSESSMSTFEPCKCIVSSSHSADVTSDKLTNDQRFQFPENHHNHESNNQHDCVGGALPPLPPSQYHRNENTRGGKRGGGRGAMDFIVSREDQNKLVESAISIFDTSSLFDTSTESATLSLPSSIAKFHASRVQPGLTPRDGYPLASTQNYTQSLDADWSPFHHQDTSLGHVTNLSVCNNPGSCSQSLEPEQSLLGSMLWEEEDEEKADKAGENKKSKNDNLKSQKFETEHCLNAEEFNEKNIKEDGNVEPHGDLFESIKKVKHEVKSHPKEVIQSEHDPRMKRMMSLAMLKKTRKVSVEKRLREFGYVKPKGKTTYYVETDNLS